MIYYINTRNKKILSPVARSEDDTIELPGAVTRYVGFGRLLIFLITK